MASQEKNKYSLAKQQVVQEYERGATLAALQRKYGIPPGPTIQRWRQQFSRHTGDQIRMTTNNNIRSASFAGAERRPGKGSGTAIAGQVDAGKHGQSAGTVDGQGSQIILPLDNAADFERFYTEGLIQFILGQKELNEDSWADYLAGLDSLGAAEWETQAKQTLQDAGLMD